MYHAGKEYVVNIQIGINSKDQLQALVGCIEGSLWLVEEAKQIFENKNNFPSDLSNMRISQHATINILIMTIKPIQLLNRDMPRISPCWKLPLRYIPFCLLTLFFLFSLYGHLSEGRGYHWVCSPAARPAGLVIYQIVNVDPETEKLFLNTNLLQQMFRVMSSDSFTIKTDSW